MFHGNCFDTLSACDWSMRPSNVQDPPLKDQKVQPFSKRDKPESFSKHPFLADVHTHTQTGGRVGNSETPLDNFSP